MTKQKLRLLLLSAAAVTALSLPALAEESVPPAASDAPAGRMMAPKDGKGPGDKFLQADANGDGFITKDEMEIVQKERMNQMFLDTDANGDGKLSPDEMQEGRKKFREKMKKEHSERREKMKEMREKREERKQVLEGDASTE